MENISNKFHLSFNNEYQFWINNIIDKWIIPDYKCPKCKKNSLKIKPNKHSISNPVHLKCSNKQCRKIKSLRYNTFFEYFKKIPISVVIKIIELFILENKNGQEIIKYIIEFYQINTLNNKMVYKIIILVRKFIAHYLKETYLEKMTNANEFANIAIDESLFSHHDGHNQIWVIGLINTRTYDFRTEAVYSRDADILEKIIRYHISIGNNIITDGWGAYNWMNAANSGFNRIIHIHGHHDFGHGDESTSHIESVWSDLKRLLSRAYVAVKSENFIYFLKECEWRKKNSHLNFNDKIRNLQEIFIHISMTVENDLFTKDELEDFDKNEYEDDLLNNNSESDEEDSEDNND